MNISNLTSGLVLKNYKELCNTLEIKMKPGTDSRKALFKDLECYCAYTKQGQKIIITEIFLEPLEKIDHRKDLDKEGNNSKYVEHVKVLILNKLLELDGKMYRLSKNHLFEFLGMVNPFYLHKDEVKKILPKKDSRFGKYEINHHYQRVNDRLTRILFDSLNSLKRKFLIKYREVDIVVKLDEYGTKIHTDANIDEISLINSAKYNALVEMKLNSMMQVIFKFKTEEFYRRVNKILNDDGIEYAYSHIELIFTKKDVLLELSTMEQQYHRKELNNKVIDTINQNARDIYYKNEKEYNEGLMDFLLNDKPAIGVWSAEQFKGFRHKFDYIDIQLELAEYLLRIE